jgi:hypothetical protein
MKTVHVLQINTKYYGRAGINPGHCEFSHTALLWCQEKPAHALGGMPADI